MSYRVLCACSLALCLIFAGAGLIQAQTAKSKDGDKASGKEADKDSEKKDEKKDEKDGEKDAEKKDEEKPLSHHDFEEVMEDIKTAWNKLKINARKKMGDKAAESADEIAKLAPKVLRYDGEVLEGDDKGKKARDQKDYKKFVEALKEAAEDYSKYAKKGDWEKADKAKDAINQSCGDCHDKYEPADED